MQRKNLSDADCPIARTVDLVGEWWSLLIIRDAFSGVTRFDDFQRSLGISRNALTERLKKLVQGGVLTRQPVSEGARREEYRLTQQGAGLVTVLVAMSQWGNRWLSEPGAPQTHVVEAGTGQHVAPLRITAADGRPLALTEIALVTDPGR